MHRSLRRFALALALVAPSLLGAQATSQAPSQIPTPASVIGFMPGTDRKLPAWSQVVAYFTALSKSSPRIQLHTLGKTTLGRPFIAAIISDSANIANLPKYREIQRRLADPRLRRPGERDSLIANGKLIVLITSSIHSDEVGGILTPLVLAHRLVSGEDAETREIRAQTIVLMVPSLNPDGVDIVGDWYRSTLGTPAEGTDPPVLYHHYTGHDNNRDWYAFTQVETQMTVDSLHNLWHPQIVNDIHQQGSDEARLFIPPYMDPIEPNVDPILISGLNALGLEMTWRLTAQGKTGITNNSTYDAWTPSRSYQHYHGGARILTETASANLASPYTISFDSLRPGRGYDSKVSSWNFLVPWQGGTWTIGNIVDYQASATWALLQAAAPMRRTWLENFSRVSERAVLGQRATGREKWPAAYLIPMQQPDQAPLRTLLRILQRGQVEIRRATANFIANRVRFSAGTYVVMLDQPYGGFAKALLENQHYPDLHEYPGGPPKAPYDVTAQTLPLLMGVGVLAVDSFPVTMTEPIAQIAPPKLEVPGLSGNTKRRIAIYRSWNPSMDEGWTRFVFDQYHIPFTVIGDREVHAGNLASRFDAIIIPDESSRGLQNGPREASYPDSLKGGLGVAGDASLHDFVSAGGTLVTFNDASRWAIEYLKLPVKDVLAGVSNRDFYAPGSLFALNLNQSHPLNRLMLAHPAAWFEDGPAFEITDSTRATAAAVYPPNSSALLSGWLLGEEKLRGHAALVDVREGKGHVVLFGYRPQYRAQSMAMYPQLWAALLGDR
ncbi:MAG TPA: M14 family zinc carboxypeptidase [Gemmatimonadaceae bacterium]